MRYRRLNFRYAMVMATDPSRTFGDLWRSGRQSVTLAQPSWRPPADVYEMPNSVCITVDLAGVDADEVDVLLYEDALVVEGQRHLPPTESAGRYHAAEIRQGPFRLEIPLPGAIDPERAEATYDRGLLQLTLGKAGGDQDGN